MPNFNRDFGLNKHMNDCDLELDFTKLISASLLRLRMKTPFLGTLAMFARFVSSTLIPTAATDGREIFINQQFLSSLPSAQQDGVLLHELLHAALLHPLRLRERQPELWNIAADIVVNGTILQEGFELPPGGLRDMRLEHLSVEEVYELLQVPGANQFELAERDLLATAIDRERHQPAATVPNAGRDLESVQTHWRSAIQQAQIVASGNRAGTLPTGIERELAAVVEPQLDWRSYLWRYLVQTPTDFQGFDRRSIGRGLYLEGLQCESVCVYVAIDTSSSVRSPQLQLFINEIHGILATYPQIECHLFYVDSEIQSSHLLTATSIVPPPDGGGGTSFIPFFERVEQIWDGHTQALCIYLTDGYGEFPTTSPALPTLWVVPPGGLDLALFPFGEAVRSLDL